jgi:hypothetical protein
VRSVSASRLVIEDGQRSVVAEICTWLDGIPYR